MLAGSPWNSQPTSPGIRSPFFIPVPVKIQLSGRSTIQSAPPLKGKGLRAPITFNDRELFLTASIGIALYPVHGDDPSTLLRRADVAMYVAKRSGGGFALYQPEHETQTLRRSGLAVFADQVHVELGGLLKSHAVDLRLPVLGKPSPSKGVHDSGQRGEELTPTRLAA